MIGALLTFLVLAMLGVTAIFLSLTLPGGLA